MPTTTKRLEWWLKEGMENQWFQRTTNGEMILRATAKRVRLPDFPELDVAICQCGRGWLVIHGVTGGGIGNSQTLFWRLPSSPSVAIRYANYYLKKRSGKNRVEVRAWIERNIRKHGLSPRYELEEVEVDE